MIIQDLLNLAKLKFQNDSLQIERLELHIEILQYLLDSGRIHNKNSALSEAELLMIILLEEDGYDIIQDIACGNMNSNSYFDALIELTDSAISKCRRTIHKTLYRQEKYWDKPIIEGETIHFASYLTTSKEDFDNTSNIKWIITPLDNDKTKAHDIYTVYNHGDTTPYPEFQVEFERDSTFVVNRIVEKDKFKEVYIKEIYDVIPCRS